MILLGTRGWNRKAWKYRLAHVLNWLPWMCWSKLVAWVEYGQEPLRDCGQDWGCGEPAWGENRCYCGKVRAPVEAARDRAALLQRPGQPCSTCGSSFCGGEGCDGVPF